MSQPKIGVLLCQIGTPSAPTAAALKPYLAKFLSDRRVIDYPQLLWKALLHGVILRTRPKKSAALYQEIWTTEGSPLLVHSLAQATLLQQQLGPKFKVALGLAYTQPSFAEALASLEAEGVERIVTLPLFPQFSTSTTGSVYDEVMLSALGRSQHSSKIIKKFIPTLRFIEPYFDQPVYIKSLRTRITEHVRALSYTPDHFILSFHGIPRRYVQEGDPYPKHCEATARALARTMGWKNDQWMMTYQSRFGHEEWLQPYTHEVLPQLYRQGIQRPVVIAPGFITDCLETLHELGIEGKEQFVEGGGSADLYSLVPCLNSHPEWVDGMTKLIQENTQGWA